MITNLTNPVFCSYVEANLIIICPCLPSLRQFFRRYLPAWIGYSGGSGRRYINDYSSGNASRSRRKHGLTLLQDDIALAESAESTHSESHIIKEVQWEVSEERLDPKSSSRAGHSASRNTPH